MRSRRILLVCALMTLTLGMTITASHGSSWTWAPQSLKQPAAANDQLCRPLLAVAQRSSSPSHAAISSGHIASSTAMGLMLGLRTAIGPREIPTRYSADLGVDNERALAVARYRQCLSQQHLNSAYASN